MSKKSSETASNYGIVKATAFWGIIISGIAGIITFIIQCLIKWNVIGSAGSVMNTVLSVLNLIANLALFISVFLAAYAHSKSKGRTFRILFWIFAVLALLSILGFNVLGMIA